MDSQHLNSSAKRPVRIAGASGGVFDRFRSIEDFASDPTIDVITGDWISEISMTFRGSEKASNRAKGLPGVSFEASFTAALEPGIVNVAKNGIKIAVNAGSCDVEALAQKVKEMVKAKGLDLKVSWVDGDDVTDKVKAMVAKGEKFLSLPSDSPIDKWGFEPISAQCYLGGMGIAEALRQGADIVVCGRVADASPVIGAAAWWHGWTREDFNELAGALLAGHLIECSAYVTGGYYTGFKKELLAKKNVTNLGFPIAEIERNGEFVITKEKNAGGIVTVGTVTSQLLYEIQGACYYNSDVTAIIDKVQLQEDGLDRIRVTNVIGAAPPPTTKVGITARGGWQAEFHFFLTGLDISEKASWIEQQTLHSMGSYRDQFHTLKFTVSGSVPEKPKNQDQATVDMRIFCQTKNADLVSAGKNTGVAPDTESFAKWCIENCLQGYPGATPAMDMRQGVGKPYFEYWVALFPQSDIDHKVHSFDGTTTSIPAPTNTKIYPRQRPFYDTASPLPANTWGETVEAPLGYIVHGRSGDKSSDCNVGLFARDAEEWDWLRSTISISKIRELLGDEDYGKKIERFEIPGVRAVHFLLRDHLDRGVNSSASYDCLGKNVCEYLRCKLVDIPKRFLDRGRI